MNAKNMKRASSKENKVHYLTSYNYALVCQILDSAVLKILGKVVKCQHTRILPGVLCIKFIGTAFLVQNPCSSRYYHVYLEKMRIQTLAPNGESQPIPNIWRRRKKKKGNNQERQKQRKGYCMRMPTEPELGITAPCKLWCTLDALFTSCKLVK